MAAAVRPCASADNHPVAAQAKVQAHLNRRPRSRLGSARPQRAGQTERTGETVERVAWPAMSSSPTSEAFVLTTPERIVDG